MPIAIFAVVRSETIIPFLLPLSHSTISFFKLFPLMLYQEKKDA